MGQGHSKYVDYWSLGLIIFEMISGINPFKIKNRSNVEKM
jgi:serine/threonine protein kinase